MPSAPTTSSRSAWRIHNYHDQNNSVPPLVENGGTLPLGAGDIDAWPLSWSASTLPQIEGMAMYNALNFNWGGLASPANTTVLNTQVAALICPSDGITTPSSGKTVRNYHANIGGPPQLGSWNGAIIPPKSDGNGINGLDGYVPPTTAQPWNSNLGTIGFASFTDGSSNTAMFSEKLVGTGPAGAVPRNHPFAKRGYGWALNGLTVNVDTGNAAEALAFAQGCQGHPRQPDVEGERAAAGQRPQLGRRQRERLPDLVRVQPLLGPQHRPVRRLERPEQRGLGLAAGRHTAVEQPPGRRQLRACPTGR